MMINHVVFDLDGTLTDRNTGNIPKSTLEAIDQLKKRGITIILATGRPYYEIDPIRDFVTQPIRDWIGWVWGGSVAGIR